MNVVCKATMCPHNNDGFCCADTILINPAGNCFDLLRGFNPENEAVIRRETEQKINFIDDEPEINITETEDVSDIQDAEEKEEVEKDDSV